MSNPEVRVVLTWHEALNAGDAERLASLSHPEIEVGGPRGAARGQRVLKDWVGRANVRLDPLRSFHSGRTVVVQEAATWRKPETDETTGEATVATVFVLDEGLVSRVFRHDNLEDALRSAGLDDVDRVQPEWPEREESHANVYASRPDQGRGAERRRVRGVPPDGRYLGTPQGVPLLRARWLLRLLQEQARHRALPRLGAPDREVLPTR